jgi:MarR family transcriptional regulator for hemolysin
VKTKSVRRSRRPASSAGQVGKEAKAAPIEAKVPQVPRIYVETVPTGSFVGSLSDKKLRLTRRILFLARRWKNQMDEDLRASGASHSRWVTLLWVDMLDGRANIGELAGHVGVELPTLIRLLNRLEEEGLVERRALAGSNRDKTVVLTAKGRPELAAMAQVISRSRAEFLEGVEEKRLDAALELLDELLAKYARVIMWPGDLK